MSCVSAKDDRVILIGCLRAASHRVQEYPRSYQVVEEADGRKIRRSPIHRFPYSLFYELLEDRIVVIAVFHARREPALRIGR